MIEGNLLAYRWNIDTDNIRGMLESSILDFEIKDIWYDLCRGKKKKSNYIKQTTQFRIANPWSRPYLKGFVDVQRCRFDTGLKCFIYKPLFNDFNKTHLNDLAVNGGRRERDS